MTTAAPEHAWIEPHRKLQTQLYNCYIAGLSPCESQVGLIQRTHERIKFLGDWLYLELLLASSPMSVSLKEMAEKFRAQERAATDELKGQPERPAPASQPTN